MGVDPSNYRTRLDHLDGEIARLEAGAARAWRFVNALVWHEGRMTVFRWFHGD